MSYLAASVHFPAQGAHKYIVSFCGALQCYGSDANCIKKYYPLKLGRKQSFRLSPRQSKISVPNFGVRHSEKNREGGTKRSQAGFPDAW